MYFHALPLVDINVNYFLSSLPPQCRSSGRCVSRYFLCDGRPHCEDSSDEDCDGTFDGSFECPEGSFQCRGDGRRTKCLAVAKVCDGREVGILFFLETNVVH